MSTLLHSYRTYESANAMGNGSFTVEPGSNWQSISTYHSPAYIQSMNTTYGSDLIKSIINRIAIDASTVEFKHLKIDPVSKNQNEIKSGLIDCLTYKANIDQTGRAFIIDLVWSLLDEGVIAIVPTVTDKIMDGEKRLMLSLFVWVKSRNGSLTVSKYDITTKTLDWNSSNL